MRKQFISAYIAGAILYLPFSMIFNYLPALARQLGATDLQIGLLSTVYFLVTIFSSPFWGAISDLVENRKLFIMGSALSFAMLLYLLSQAMSPFQVILLRGGIGVVFPAFSVPIIALLSERSTSHSRGSDISWFNAFRGGGSMLGLVIIGYLTVFHSLAWIFKLLGFFALLTVPPILLLPGQISTLTIPSLNTIVHEIKSRVFPESEVGASLLRKNGLIFLYASVILRAICIVGFNAFLPVFITEKLGLSLQFLGTFSAVGSGVMIISMLVSGYAADVFGRKLITLIGLFLSFLTPICYFLSTSVFLFIWVGRAFNTFSYSFVYNGTSAFVGDIARKREQGALMGWITLSFGIGGVVGPSLAGTILGTYSYLEAALFTGFIGLLAFFLTFLKVEKPIKAEN